MKYSTGFQNTNLCAISQTDITRVCSFAAQDSSLLSVEITSYLATCKELSRLCAHGVVFKRFYLCRLEFCRFGAPFTQSVFAKYFPWFCGVLPSEMLCQHGTMASLIIV